jgi:hypothetical protein
VQFAGEVAALVFLRADELLGEAAEFVLRFLDQYPDYRAYHRHTLASDEIFFQSILAGTDFLDTHNLINDPLRFMIWPDNSSHPRILGREDLPAMLESGAPFARKFDLEHDPAVIEQLSA